MKDFYTILGLSSGATEAEIKSAYRKLAKELHPDVNKAPGAEARFKEVNEAHETLKDPARKAAYDAQRQGGTRSSFSWSTGGGFNSAGPDFDLDEVLRDIRRSRYSEPPRNRDVVLNYAITLEEAFTGKEAEVSYVLANQTPREVKFKIPAGFHDGMRLRFQGHGDDAIKEVSPGDLYVRVSVIPHARFIRMGDHLVTSVTIDYLDAILGAEVELDTIEGGRIKLNIPKGVLPGQNMRVAGKGMAISSGVRGDMMVEVVMGGFSPTAEQVELLEKVRALRDA